MTVRDDAATWSHANVDGGVWPIAERDGLEIDTTGALVLGRLPSLTDASSGLVAPVPGLTGPAGIGIDPCGGDIYVADPGNHRIVRIDPCDGAMTPLGCTHGPGADLGALNEPRGVIVGPRRALYVADSGNARIQVYDIATGQRIGVWGQQSLFDDPAPSDEPGRFNAPWDLAVDAAGMIYVADPGLLAADGTWSKGRVQRFNADGDIDATFGAVVASSPSAPGSPVSIAIVRYPDGSRLDNIGDNERLLVLDQQPARLLVFRPDGQLDAEATLFWSRVAGTAAAPVALAAGGGQLFVSDASGRLLVFDRQGQLTGTQRGDAALAGLAVDCQGRLVARPGAGGAVQRGLGLPSRTVCGTALLGPFIDPIDREGGATIWQRLNLALDVPDGTYVRLFTLTSRRFDGVAGNLPPAPMNCAGMIAAGIVPEDTHYDAALDRWRAVSRDATDFLALNVSAPFLWVWVALEGDGTATPTVRQLTVTFDEPGWMELLPALYRREPVTRVLLGRMLQMYESAFVEDEALLDGRARQLDPRAAGDVPRGDDWLDWLGGWVDAGLVEQWPDDTRRERVAAAFRAHARRGTPASLRELVELYTGVRPTIDELVLQASPWVLGESALAMTTALTVSSADGAVLGTTAILDRSHIGQADEYGEALYDETAHRFVVHVYAADAPSADAIASLRAVLDREKPAHTVYDLCVIGARMRVGVQARVGVDTIVAGPLPASPIGDGLTLGVNAVLAEVAPGAGRAALGAGARVGIRSTVV